MLIVYCVLPTAAVWTFLERRFAVFAPDFGGYTTSAQGPQPLQGAIDELFGGFGGSMTAEGDRWQADLTQALREHRFRYVLLETHECCLKDRVTAAGYVTTAVVWVCAYQLGWVYRHAVRSGADECRKQNDKPKDKIH